MVQSFLWLILGAVHGLPAVALFGPGLVTRMYGIAPGNPAFLLVQHRAGLFLCVLIVCLWAMVDPGVRRLGVVVVGVSMLSFLILFRMNGSPSFLQTIALVDLVALPALFASAYLAWKS